MKRHARREKTFCLFAPSGLHPLVRAAIVLLALVQIIAPTWHVCALGAMSCTQEHEKQAEVWKPKCGGGPKCPCVPPKGAIVSPTGQVLSAPANDDFHGTCLAQLLMGMPGSVAAPFHFVFFVAQHTAFAPSLFIAPFVASMPQPPSRGPPVFCV